jgi:hypothetical protein
MLPFSYLGVRVRVRVRVRGFGLGVITRAYPKHYSGPCPVAGSTQRAPQFLKLTSLRGFFA